MLETGTSPRAGWKCAVADTNGATLRALCTHITYPTSPSTGIGVARCPFWSSKQVIRVPYPACLGRVA